MRAHISSLILLIGISSSIAQTNALNCSFEDTVNLTLSQKFMNGSYLYERVIVPPELTSYYDYIERYGGERQIVTRHLRGCVCYLKPCVKFCCHPRAGMTQSDEDLKCDEEVSDELLYSPYVNITLRNGSRVLMNVVDEFVVQTGMPCKTLYMLEPHKYDADKWELFENGTLLRVSDQMYFSTRDYCLQAYPENGTYMLDPMNCMITNDIPTRIKRNTIVLMISSPFLYATILIYWLVPELWNLHTKCLIGYLLSLAIGTTTLVVVNMMNADYDDVTCAIIGFGAYYFLLAVFFWLNVICFDLWHNFRGTKGNVQNLSLRKRFTYYSVYAWGVPALMTTLTILIQYSNLPNNIKSGIGDSHCWLKMDDWSAMIYFYGPCLFLVIFNIVIFYLTAKTIYTIRKEIRRFSKGADSQRHLHSQQHNFWLFFRMFIVMGINWLLEIIGYMIGENSDFEILIAVADFYNAAQGIIIFVLLVMKRKVLLLLKKRIRKSDNSLQLSERQNTKTNASTVELRNLDVRTKLRN
ncbi:G-protein coupled receptor Mth2-like [Eurosta solidaginis]|uniref:G-protein coupled receptor Mth2-like n=1 Tax=Eurosta solidaginis TaxID=178769 RepID=UPI0035308678